MNRIVRYFGNVESLVAVDIDIVYNSFGKNIAECRRVAILVGDSDMKVYIFVLPHSIGSENEYIFLYFIVSVLPENLCDVVSDVVQLVYVQVLPFERVDSIVSIEYAQYRVVVDIEREVPYLVHIAAIDVIFDVGLAFFSLVFRRNFCVEITTVYQYFLDSPFGIADKQRIELHRRLAYVAKYTVDKLCRVSPRQRVSAEFELHDTQHHSIGFLCQICSEVGIAQLRIVAFYVYLIEQCAIFLQVFGSTASNKK
jgi:hypothetical protein